MSKHSLLRTKNWGERGLLIIFARAIPKHSLLRTKIGAGGGGFSCLKAR